MTLNETPAPQDDSLTVRQRVLAFLETEWPPAGARELYNLGWQRLPALGKEVCVRAALAAYEVSGDRARETPFEASARRAVESWVLDPSEDNRKAAGRIASVEQPSYSMSRALANLAGSNNRWRSAVGAALVRNPYYISSEKFETIRDAVARELFEWASGAGDPVAARFDPPGD